MSDDTEKLRHRLQEAAYELRRMRQRLAEHTKHETEPIAVVGIGCQFPGGVTNADDLWDLVMSDTEVIEPAPPDRGWPDNNFRGGFLTDAAGFDAAFFTISPREARTVDPQHRHLLETSWHALEHAHIDPTRLHGTNAGVFIGIIGNAYGTHSTDNPGHLLTGTATSVASGRIAYHYGLHGPALSIDTACSSSLVAINLACQSLRHHQCTLALAGGVTIMPTPAILTGLSDQGALSPDGRCKPFSAHADGMSASEGAAILVLERLTDAQRHNHRILALITGSAVNQDGASNGLTAPHGPAQEAVIGQALTNARITPDHVDAIEAHGTGTILGDPIEARALQNAYTTDRDHPLWLGSIKSNIGHTQAAAGAAGLIKMIQALRRRQLPPTRHAAPPSPHINWNTPLRLLTEPTPWPATDHTPTAGISSFGISGTNAHLIVQQPPPQQTSPTQPPSLYLSFTPIPLSAKTPAALHTMAARLSQHLAAHPQLSVQELAAALSADRAHLNQRAVVTCTNRDDLTAGLDALVNGATDPRVVESAIDKPGRTVFIFPGQGSQRPGMGKELYRASPVFAEMLDEVCEFLDPHLDLPLREVMFAEAGSADAPLLNQTRYTQPALFALSIALYRLARHHGVRCDYVAGHSFGEVAAAYAADSMNLADACMLIAVRSRLMDGLPPGGAMAAVRATEEEVADSIGDFTGVCVAAVNGPTETVVSGGADAVGSVADYWRARDCDVRMLTTSHAFHSGHMDPILAEYRRYAADLTISPPSVPVVSTVTGMPVTHHEWSDPDYWVRHARDTVRFADSVRWLRDHGATTFVELSPHPTLLSAIEHTCEQHDREHNTPAPTVVTCVQCQSLDGRRAFVDALSHLYVHGHTLDWTALHGRRDTHHLDLPLYPFEHRHYWLARSDPATTHRDSGHPLIQSCLDLPDGTVLLTGCLSPKSTPWLTEHTVAGATLFPAVGLIDLLLHAGRCVGCDAVEEITLHTPLALADSAVSQLQVLVGPPDRSGRRSATVHSRFANDHEWTEHAIGTVMHQQISQSANVQLPPNATPIDITTFYEQLLEYGYEYGSTFACLRRAWQHGSEIYADVAPSTDLDNTDELATRLGLLDSALHTIALLSDVGSLPLPYTFRDAVVVPAFRATDATLLRVRLTQIPNAQNTFALLMCDEQGSVVAAVGGITTRSVTATGVSIAGGSQWLHELVWHQMPGPRDAVGDDVADDVPIAARDLRIRHVPPTVGDPIVATRIAVRWALKELQQFLAEEPDRSARLVFVTRRAVAIRPGETVISLHGAAIWGLVRCAQAEHPGRFVLLDADTDVDADDVPYWVVNDEPQIGMRTNEIHVPRLLRARGPDLGLRPEGAAWHLTAGDSASGSSGKTEKGISALAVQPDSDTYASLASDQIRIQVRAAGVNFRDALIVLGMLTSDTPWLGSEAAGIVIEVGSAVTDIAVRDHVTGLVSGAFGATAIAHSRAVVPIPDQWSFPAAATMPIAFATAWYALVNLADIQPGRKVLVHAATGGVGLAAIQIAQSRGSEVFATASPTKHWLLRSLGLDDKHIASSRTLDFGPAFLDATMGQGVDVVLNSLTSEFIDASMRLLGRGGYFVEIGKTDIRDAAAVSRAHPGIHYHVFDLGELEPDELHAILAQLLAEFSNGALTPLPLTAWDVRDARQAVTAISRAQHIGKNVLTIPTPFAPDGTVLITGGTGTLGGLLARHLVERHGVRHLLLMSRSGLRSRGTTRLCTDLSDLGATVRVAECDASDREALSQLLNTIPDEHPLSAVVHCAGVTNDAPLSALTDAKIDAVARPKIDAAWHLHCLTQDRNLTAFIMFSSAAATLGSPGQGGYGAANAFLDGLSVYRHRLGLPALSLAWGLWEEPSALTEHLSFGDRARIRRAGVLPLSTPQALALFDAALTAHHPTLIPARITAVSDIDPSPLIRTLIGHDWAANRTEPTLAQQLSTAPENERDAVLLGAVIRNAALVLDDNPDDIEATQTFKSLGFDSLTAVELRNRLAAAADLTLPSTVVFDHPTPTRLADYLRGQLTSAAPDCATLLTRLESLLTDLSARAAIDSRTRAGLSAVLLRSLAVRLPPAGTPSDVVDTSDEQMFAYLDHEFGSRP